MYRPSPRPAVSRRARSALAALLAIVLPAALAAPSAHAAAALADTIRLSVVPLPAAAAAGDTVLVEFTVPVSGPAFNAYDAYLSYDPAVLRFLRPANLATQEGPLMTAACALRFHVFEADTVAGRLRVSHSLLCAGRSVTGPGVVYRVRFACREVDADTPLSLLVTAPHKTAFFNAGLFVTPMVATGATVRVGTPWVAPAPLPPVVSSLSDLRASPNPFNPRTTISLEAAVPGDVAVTVHSPDGRLVRRLWQGRLEAGPWSTTWDGRDDAGRPVAAGIYLVRARPGGGPSLSSRVALVR